MVEEESVTSGGGCTVVGEEKVAVVELGSGIDTVELERERDKCCRWAEEKDKTSIKIVLSHIIYVCCYALCRQRLKAM